MTGSYPALEREADEIDLELSRIELKARRIVDRLGNTATAHQWREVVLAVTVARGKVRRQMNPKRREETYG